MKTLCMITHKLMKGDGQGRVNFEVLMSAHAAGYAIVLLASECAPEVIKLENVTWISIPVEGWPSHLLRNQFFAIKSWLWLRKYAKDIDLIHANGFITWYPAGINTSHFVHGAWQRSPYNTIDAGGRIRRGYHRAFTWLNALLERRSYKQARWVIAVSPKVAEELISIGVDSKKIVVISNGVDLDEYCPGTAARDFLGLKESDHVALFAGDLRSSRKNLETVFRALDIAQSWHLVVLGKIELSPYPELARTMGIADRVHFMGYRTDITHFLHAVDLLAFPSRYDPWAMIVSEALACAVPVITARTVGAAFQVDKNAGWVLDDPDDFHSLADILIYYQQSEQSIKTTMSKAARNAVAGYSWPCIANKYLGIYAEYLEYKSRDFL